MIRKHLISKSISKIKIITGIFLNKVLQGPYQVYVNVTDHCNLNCLMCSQYSPLVSKKVDSQGRAFLKNAVLNELVTSFNSLHVQLVTITGGGEPFLHPYLMDFVRALSQAKKDVTIVTNGTIVKHVQLSELIRLDVNLRFSLIAATPDTYVEVHPNQKATTFEKLRDNLAFIRDLRKRIPSRSTVSILFVIFKNNFHEIPKMLEMGEEYGVDFVHFKPAIFDYEEMKALFLNSTDLRKLREMIQSLQNTHDIPSTELRTVSYGLEANQKLLTNMGASEMKRTAPCYKGWTFCWVLADGSVVPCCDCNTPLGNINEMPLERIWYSRGYSALRKNMITRHGGMIRVPGCKCDTCKPDPEEVRIAKVMSLAKGEGLIHKENILG